MGIKSDPDNENSKYNNVIYYYKEQDRRGIETVTDPSGKQVPVSLKNTTVNVHCDIDDDYILHPDQGFGVHLLVDRYVEQKNSAGNMVDDYNNNVVYDAQGNTVTYSEDFPIQGRTEKVTVIDKSGRKPCGSRPSSTWPITASMPSLTKRRQRRTAVSASSRRARESLSALTPSKTATDCAVSCSNIWKA